MPLKILTILLKPGQDFMGLSHGLMGRMEGLMPKADPGR